MNKPIIHIDIEDYRYKGEEQVLKSVHLELHPGTITCVLGPSGAGKSTLLRVLMGIEKSDYKSLHTFSLVPQSSYLFPWKTVFQNIALGLRNAQNKDDIHNKVMQMLKTVGLSGVENKYPFEISVGMSQRVSFARAMINPFKVLLLDEPFSSLDPFTRRELQNWLLKIIKHNESYALFVTHDITEAIYLSQNIYLLSDMPATVIELFIKQEDHLFLQKNTGVVLTADELNKNFLKFYMP